MEQAELSVALKSFTGTTRFYRHWAGILVFTDGAKFLADEAKAYWLIDAIAFRAIACAARRCAPRISVVGTLRDERGQRESRLLARLRGRSVSA